MTMMFCDEYFVSKESGNNPSNGAHRAITEGLKKWDGMLIHEPLTPYNLLEAAQKMADTVNAKNPRCTKLNASMNNVGMDDSRWIIAVTDGKFYIQMRAMRVEAAADTKEGIPTIEEGGSNE